MNIKLLQENFSKALTRISRIVPPRPQIPILQNIKLSAKKDGLEITATNTETTETVWIGGKVEKEGGVCVSARVLFEFVSSLPAETVHVIAKEETLNVACGGFQAKFPIIAASEFPPAPSLNEKERGTMEKEALEDALSAVLFAAATDEGRPILTGVKVVVNEEGTRLVATDGYRLSVKKVEKLSEKLSGATIPARALSEVVKLGGEEKEEKKINVGLAGEKQVGFVVGETTILTRLLDGEYPNFERIIPKTFTTRALIEREPLLRAVRSAAIFARDNANIVKLRLDKQKIVISANAPQVGENSVEVEAKIDGEGGEIAFNSRFLIDFLTNFSQDELLFEMTGSLNSGVFKPTNDESYLHIIMPVRVQA